MKVLYMNNYNIRSRNTNKQNTKPNDLPIFMKYMDLIEYMENIINKYPKSERFGLIKQIKESTYDGFKYLMYGIKMYDKNSKIKYLTDLSVELAMQKVDIRLSYKNKYISIKNYEAWCKKILLIEEMLGGWIISCQKR